MRITYFTFWYRWLIVVSFSLILAGIYTSFFKSTSLDAPFRLFIDSVFWKDGSTASGTTPFGAFVYSVWGAAIVMWGTQLFFILKFAFKKKEPWAWWAILISTLLWFLIAAGFSLYYGATLNALGDLVYMLLLVLPLFMTRRQFIPNK
jgi:hypothetical protein